MLSVTSAPQRPVPSLRLHKSSGQFVADFDGKTVYRFGRKEADAWVEYLPRTASWRVADDRRDRMLVQEAIVCFANMAA